MLTIISFVTLLLVLIFVHELGHFIAAKMVGVKVLRFSLGFPPKALSKTIGETEYQLAWLPLGGYVKMYGEDPDSDEPVPVEMQKRSFSHQPPWAKIVIVLAGPVFNLVFAALLYWCLIWGSGIQHLQPVLGPVAPLSPAYEAGLMMDDVIVEINGTPTLYFDHLETALATGEGAPLNLVVLRNGLRESYSLNPVRVLRQNVFGEELPVYEVGLTHRLKPIISKVVKGSPAAQGGLMADDLIIAIDGRPILDWEDVLWAIQGPPQERGATSPRSVRPLLFEVVRGGQSQTFEITPQLNVSQNHAGENVFTPMIGMESKIPTITEPVGFFKAGFMAIDETKRMIGLTLSAVKKLVTGEVSAKTLGGPILIAEVTGDKARAGWVPLLTLAAFISINLGILNLLP
ncbi:MAG: RIP metalloprotease RseP, partial [Candidatus Adiutrix sp.]